MEDKLNDGEKYVPNTDIIYKIKLFETGDDLKNDGNDGNDDNNMLLETTETNNRVCTFKKLREKTKYHCEIEIATKLRKGHCVSIAFETCAMEDCWSQACCNKIQRINEYEIGYSDTTQADLYHKMHFGRKMIGKGIFQIEILIVDASNGGRAGRGFVFGVAVERNKYFACGKVGWGGFGNDSEYGCSAGANNYCFGGVGKPFSRELQTNDKVTCRLDLNQNMLSFKLNDGNFVNSKFKGLTDENKRNGFYFAYSTARHNSRIRVLSCCKVD